MRKGTPGALASALACRKIFTIQCCQTWMQRGHPGKICEAIASALRFGQVVAGVLTTAPLSKSKRTRLMSSCSAARAKADRACTWWGVDVGTCTQGQQNHFKTVAFRFSSTALCIALISVHPT